MDLRRYYEEEVGWGLDLWRSLFVLLSLERMSEWIGLIGIDANASGPLRALALDAVAALEQADEDEEWYARSFRLEQIPGPEPIRTETVIHGVFQQINSTIGNGVAEHLFVLEKTSRLCGVRHLMWVSRLDELTADELRAMISPHCSSLIDLAPEPGWWQINAQKMSESDRQYLLQHPCSGGDMPEDASTEMHVLNKVGTAPGLVDS